MMVIQIQAMTGVYGSKVQRLRACAEEGSSAQRIKIAMTRIRALLTNAKILTAIMSAVLDKAVRETGLCLFRDTV
jgi:hypothetical protein